MKRRVEFTASALAALARMDKVSRRFVLDGIRARLAENDPAQASRNKFRLKRPSPHAEWELRLGVWRVFYRVAEGARLAAVSLIGEKQGNQLFIDGEKLEL